MNKIIKVELRCFGHGGPYNPLRYVNMKIPYKNPKSQEIRDYIKKAYEIPESMQRNMRHIHPVRQSGPLPPYDGPHTMEDIIGTFQNVHLFPQDKNYCSTDVEEIMRRVPGIRRKDAEYITSLGFDPDEEVDFAYIAHNNGIDLRYKPNQVFVGRQVVTDSKGRKQEIMFPNM